MKGASIFLKCTSIYMMTKINIIKYDTVIYSAYILQNSSISILRYFSFSFFMTFYENGSSLRADYIKKIMGTLIFILSWQIKLHILMVYSKLLWNPYICNGAGLGQLTYALHHLRIKCLWRKHWESIILAHNVLPSTTVTRCSES